MEVKNIITQLLKVVQLNFKYPKNNRSFLYTE